MNVILKRYFLIPLMIIISLTVFGDDSILSDRQTQLVTVLKTLRNNPKDANALITLKSLKNNTSDLLGSEWFYACFFVSDFLSNNKQEAKKSYSILKSRYSNSDAFSVANMNNMYKNCEKCNGTGEISINCTRCHGSGICNHCNGRRYMPTMMRHHRVSCPSCNGTGKCKKCNGKGTIVVRCTKCYGKKHKFSKEKLWKTQKNIYDSAIRYAEGFVKYNDQWVTKEEKEKIDAGYLFYNNEWISPKEYKNKKLDECVYEGFVECNNEFLLNPPAAGVGLLKNKIVEYTGFIVPMQNTENGSLTCVSFNKENGFLFWLAPKYTDKLAEIKFYDLVTIRGVHTGRHKTMEILSQSSIKIDQLKQQYLASEGGNVLDNQTKKIPDSYIVNMQIITNAQLVIQKGIDGENKTVNISETKKNTSNNNEVEVIEKTTEYYITGKEGPSTKNSGQFNLFGDD